MARKTVLISDLSGEQIPEGEAASVVITTNGSRYSADVAASEVAYIISKARRSKRPGRKSKAAA